MNPHSIARSLLLAALAAVPLAAQTQLVRGDIDAVQHTAGQFVLKCTNIRLVSTAVNLQALHDLSRQQNIEFDLQVRDVSNPTQTTLEVLSATQMPERFQMGNLRFNRTETWEVRAAPGSPVAVGVNDTALTSYLPLGAWGTWLIGNGPIAFNGFVDPTGIYKFGFQMPSIQALVGVSFTAQAVVVENGAVSLLNPDCKTVRAD